MIERSSCQMPDFTIFYISNASYNDLNLSLKISPVWADNYCKFMRIGLRILELAFGVIKTRGWKEISIPFFCL